MKRLFELGCRPLYDTFREVNVATGITTATWRVYFVSTSCPFPLMKNGTVCDQVMFGGRLFPAHGKTAPYPSERLPFGYRSAYAIDLTDHPPLRESPVQPPQGLSRSRSSQPTSQAIRHLDSSLKRATVTRTTATPAPSSTPLVVLPPSPSVDLSISSPSSRMLTPPPSPPRRLGPVADTAIIVRRRKNKRSRSADDFSHLTTKERPKDETGVTTSNYISVHEQIETEYELVDLPVIHVPDAVKKSAEASHFLTKHHTKIVKTSKPIPVAETAEAMIGDVADVELDLRPDRLNMAASRVTSAHKVLNSATNADKLIQFALQSPLALNHAILERMRDQDCTFQEVAQLLLLNRILAASQPGEDTTFHTKWTKALAFFELMLMCTAPSVFHKDHWLQRCSGQTVAWIPAHHARLLHPNMLLALLRSRVGELCMQQWQRPSGRVQYGMTLRTSRESTTLTTISQFSSSN
ncbi:hypothetical protein Plhal703r1_c17g0079191 [Plasmopara halstedii]